MPNPCESSCPPTDWRATPALPASEIVLPPCPTGGSGTSSGSGSGSGPDHPPMGSNRAVATKACPIPGSVTHTFVTDGLITFEDDVVILGAPNITVKLPDPALGHGPGADWFFIKNMCTTTAIVTVDGNGTPIDGSGTLLLAQYESVILINNVVNWMIFGGP